MVDRENVIEALERCINGNHDGCQYKYGGAATFEHCRSDLMRDALALLKEQEAVEPKWFRDMHNPAGAFRCGACEEIIVEKNIDFYCPKCGRKVKWDG